jgi:hypothetical protein
MGWNSLEFHNIEILLQPIASTLNTVALLTGRVYQDGLGGLRAVLFHFLVHASVSLVIVLPPLACFVYPIIHSG